MASEKVTTGEEARDCGSYERERACVGVTSESAMRVKPSVHGNNPCRGNAAGKPFTLATFFGGRPEDGGGFVHKSAVLRILKRMQGPDLKVIVICDDDQALKIVSDMGLPGVLQRRNIKNRLTGALCSAEIVKRYLGRSFGARMAIVDKLLRSLTVDLVLFSGPDTRALQLYSHSYIFSIWDMTHLEHPEFPEVSMFGEFERREWLYARAARRAIAVLADSESARKLIANSYRIPQSRIYSAPFLMAPTMGKFRNDQEKEAIVRRRYGLVDPYIFYPAQFWLHKNHRYILSALRLMLDEYGWAPQAVFCGSDKGAFSLVMQAADRLKIRHLVNYCGFVPEVDMPYLYASALALVMPTYSGPNNIPPWEALALGIPVLYSDFPSFREVMGNSATYIDLQDPRSLAQALHEIRNHRGGRESASQGGRGLRQDPEHMGGMYLQILKQIIQDFRVKMS